MFQDPLNSLTTRPQVDMEEGSVIPTLPDVPGISGAGECTFFF